MNDTGGSAFPNNFGSPKNQGMTLRDYFAAKAMQADLSRSGYASREYMSDDANKAYRMADAMLKARDGNS